MSYSSLKLVVPYYWFQNWHQKTFELVLLGPRIVSSVAWTSVNIWYEPFTCPSRPSRGFYNFLDKLDGFLDIFCHLESIPLFDGVYTSMVIKYLGHTYELIRVLGEAPFPIPFGWVEYPIISCIGLKSDLVTSLMLFMGYHVSSPVSWFTLNSHLSSIIFLWMVKLSNLHILYLYSFLELNMLWGWCILLIPFQHWHITSWIFLPPIGTPLLQNFDVFALCYL